ncbi:MAG TPA: CHAT domain-containing protein [Ktedonobacteraceae bacterium]|nr:CHAT domain-containing protein [Ktedonobacteraceae bacterium]
MNEQEFLQQLRDLPIEQGRAYIEQHIAELTDHAAIGQLIRDESLRQRDIHPLTSLKLAELLIFFAERVQHAPSHARGLASKGSALSAVGFEQAAMDNLDAAAEEHLRLGDEIGWAHTRIPWIVSCAWLGRVEEALQQAARAREVFVKHNELLLACHLDHNTAVIYSQIGDYQKALELYDRMLAIYPTLTDQSEASIKRAIAMVEINQARNLTWLGIFEQAYHLLLRARERLIPLEQPGLLIKAEINLANLDYIQGYYGSALRYHYQIRDNEIQNNLDNTGLFASTTLRMARCLVKLNRVEEACLLAANAIEIYRQLSSPIDAGEALQEYAATLVASNKLKDAITILDEAYGLFNRGNFVHHATAIKLQQAELLLEMGSAIAAYEQAKLLKAYFDNQGLISRSAAARLIMAGALIKKGRDDRILREKEQQLQCLKEAALLCEQVISLSSQYNLQEQSYKGQYLLGQIAATQNHFEEAEKHYSIAIEQIEHILDDLVLDLRPSFLRSTWVLYEDMIALCLQQSQFERAFSYLERARSLALRQYLDKPKRLQNGIEIEESAVSSLALQARNAAVLRMQNELSRWQSAYHFYSTQLATLDAAVSPEVDREVLEAELRRSEEKVSELFERLHLQQVETDFDRNGQRFVSEDEKHWEHIDIALIRQSLAPDQLLLTYFLYKGRLVIFAITKEQMVIHENPDGIAQLERLLPPLYAHLEPRGWPDPLQPPQLAIRRLLQKLYGLLIAPVASLLPPSFGSITIVPYGLLHNLPFHALHNGTHFLIEDFQINYLPATSILTQLHTCKHTTHSKPPLILGYSGNGHLQRALEEAKALQIMLDGSCYLDDEATIERLIKQAPGSPIIHLATHGKCRLDAPNFSYVRLADGPFNAIDAFSLDLEDCQLVTLSGCETGLALSGGGDEQLGLGRAFLSAGAPSLVMSLWPVEDSATNELMLLFYRYLLNGDSKVQALRSAQCSLLRRSDSLYSHPYFWAAFHLVGDVEPLQFGAPRETHQ